MYPVDKRNIIISHTSLLFSIFIFTSLLFQGCIGSFGSPDPEPVNTSPNWAQGALATSPEAYDDEIKYADTGPPDVSEKRPSNALGLVTDHVNTQLTRLADYTTPAPVKKPGKKGYKRQKPKDKRQGPDTLKGYSRGYGLNQDLNIQVNTAPPASKILSPAAPLSPVEQRYNTLGELTQGKKLRQFGYDTVTFTQDARAGSRAAGMGREKKGAPLFSQDESTRLFADSKTGNGRFLSDEYSSMRPMLPEYVMAPGDEIFIKITGPFDMAEVFTVDRNGEVFIPRVGSIALGGKPAAQLQKIIQGKTRTVFMNANVQASLGRLRSIQVTVTGQVKKPGLIQVTAGSTLLNALAAAGGPAKTGTLRSVELRRRNATAKRIDLYGVILGGDFSQDPQVLPGDIIHVGPTGPTVAILSPGTPGAIYETLPGETLDTLAKRMGILNNFIDTETILAERTGPLSDRAIQAFNYEDKAITFTLSDGDIFQFFANHAYSYNSVEIQGPVLRPGTFPYEKGMRVSDLLKLARGFLVSAALDKALLIRELGDDKAFNIMVADGRGSHRKQLIWLDLDRILAGDADKDLSLARLDRLKLFTLKDRQPVPMIKIIGGVRKPGEYHLTSGMTLGDLILLAGGPTHNAYEGESSIVRRRHSPSGKGHFDVKIIPFILNRVLNREKASRIILENHDKIVIRKVNTMEVSVKIQGWVQFPGTYILPSGSRITDLVALAGGILTGSDLRAAVFQRRRVRDLENKNLKTFYATVTERFARVRDEVTLTGHPNESLANQLSLLGQDRLVHNMKQFQATGRVVIDMTADDFPGQDDNMILEDRDSLSIPQKMTTVTVMGRIFNPSAYLWKQGLSVEDYLEKSGGLLEDADKDRVYVVMANGEVKSAAQKGGKSELMGFHPNAGDIVFVPQESLGRSGMAQVMDVLQVLRMIVGTGAIAASIPNMSSATPSLEVKTDNYQRQNIVNEFRPELYEDYRQWSDNREMRNE